MSQEKNIELEIRYQVLDEKKLKDFLKDLEFLGKKQEIDVYFDTSGRDLYKKGYFIRVRNNKSIDFKYKLPDIKHDECFKDYSFPRPLTKSSLLKINQICKVLGLQGMKTLDLERFKADNHFVNSMIIDKIREKYKDKKFEYCLDNIKGLGVFLEIESLIANEKEAEKLKEEMKDRVKELELKRITTGYCGVYWRKYNFDLYLQGRYLFEEDYKKYRHH